MISKKNNRKYIGIVREVYNKWERRAPLCPSHVKELTKNGINVLLQSSNSRIFTNEQYEHAGAIITEDLTSASIILGVKQVPVESLLENKTYMFFSHTIKAQKSNMLLLDTILEKKIRLIDYECITENGDRKGKRLIAFGSYAGRAGMIDTFRGIGERLLCKGYSTPFLNIGSAYMYNDLTEAKKAIELAGNYIYQNGIPKDLSPMTFIFTGNGNVSKGAQEIFKLMPHEMIHVNDLPNLHKEKCNQNNHLLYGCIVPEEALVQLKKDVPESPSSSLLKSNYYYSNPHLYEPIFHKKVLPYSSCIINCIYWDERYPRLITKKQINKLYNNKNNKNKLIGIGDITCDIGGSIEFLDYSTEIEKPFYLYNPITNQINHNNLEGENYEIMMMGVDILPSELPKESSEYFGSILVKYIKELVHFNNNNNNLSNEIKGAIIAENGTLNKKYEYIQKMRETEKINLVSKNHNNKHNTTKPNKLFILLEGHLFDTNLINQTFNLIEKMEGDFIIRDMNIRPNFKDNNKNNNLISTVIIEISFDKIEKKKELLNKLKLLSTILPNAEATVIEIPYYNKNKNIKTNDKMSYQNPIINNSNESETVDSIYNSINTPKRKNNKTNIVCFGAGMVSGPLIEYLSRNTDNQIHILSGIKDEGKKLIQSNKILKKRLNNIITCNDELNVLNEKNKIEKLFKEIQPKCIISLLPASMHTIIAEICIKYHIPLVTASYISNEMKNLHDNAMKANIPILCELGLDPGMDHMSAMKIIDEYKNNNNNQVITSFSSVCGGLPAPEVADNPIGYKFSWSPKGVLMAALNSATYLKNGKEMNISGNKLLNSAEKVSFLPSFSIEQIPNRNSLPYLDIYGLNNKYIKNLYRGTLRYAGSCAILAQCRDLGLFDTSINNNLPDNWYILINELISKNSLIQLNNETNEFLRWLGLFSFDTSPKINNTLKNLSILDIFCQLLQNKLTYLPGERDMAIMHHEFIIENKKNLHSNERNKNNNKLIKKTSTFIGYGDGVGYGETIMAKTVGLTAAIGVELIINNQVNSTGVLTPTTPDIYIPGLKKLENENIRFIEKTYISN